MAYNNAVIMKLSMSLPGGLGPYILQTKPSVINVEGAMNPKM